MIGSSSLFVLHHPVEFEQKKKDGVHLEEITYDLAQEEIAANSGFDMAKGSGQTKSTSYRSFFRLHIMGLLKSTMPGARGRLQSVTQVIELSCPFMLRSAKSDCLLCFVLFIWLPKLFGKIAYRERDCARVLSLLPQGGSPTKPSGVLKTHIK